MSFRRWARAVASSIEPAELQGDGINRVEMFSGPSAAAAITATRAESMPPLKPKSAFPKPHLRA